MNLPTENNLTLLKKYFNEAVLLTLSACVVYLFLAYKDLNTYIRDEFIQKTVEMTITIKDNTKVIDENIKTLKETQTILNKQK